MEVTTWTEALSGKRVALGDSASMQAETRVNAEHASKGSVSDLQELNGKVIRVLKGLVF